MTAEWKIALTDLAYDETEVQAVTEVLRSRWLTMGPCVAEFEAQVQQAFNVNCAIMVSNGTTALHLALRVIDCSPADEVIVPALTFVATANAVLYCGATPVFADIVSLTEPNISPSAIAGLLSPRTKAVIVVHYAGYSCRMEEIKSVLDEYMQKTGRKIWLIEDAAHSIGGKSGNGEWLGCAGDIGCFSFFSNKNLATGEGGLILTNNPELGGRLRLLRSHSMTRTTLEHHHLGLTDYDVIDLGYNYRPTEITAALAKVQFNKLENNNRLRRELTAYYHKLLKGVRDITLPFADTNTIGQPACHLLPILLTNADTVKIVRRHLHQQRIQTSHHYRPIVDFSYYRRLFGDQSAKVPLTFEYSQRELTLPLHPKLTFDDVEYIVHEIKTALEQNQ